MTSLFWLRKLISKGVLHIRAKPVTSTVSTRVQKLVESFEGFIFMGLQDTSTTSSPSGPKDAFSRSPFRFDIKQHQYLRAAKQSPGSGRWLLRSQDFIDWKEADGVRKLWLVGELGAGKTILVSTVIHHLLVKYSSKDFACLYVYFDYSEQRQQTYDKLLAHLLHQLLRQRDGATPEVQAVYENMRAKNIPLGPDEYIDMIKSEIRAFTKVFIVVDALDECLDEPPEHTASNFVRALDQLPKRTRILFTSRPMTTINDRIKADKMIRVQTDVNDIATYFENRINNTDWLKKLVEKGTQKDPRFFKKAVDTIISRSQGMHPNS
ncbi:hypothetical protein F5144DRAFT_64935 [Chaetomium tenue]|uniref:Uncharacterized protein n=1 Tax=Chaetomium tenue TaxID=1854479 RepID=A0ACB7PPT0_9PEZI|nr:hypothetical protein F5144DRAFT_64935 [Chaetomium globosum]